MDIFQQQSMQNWKKQIIMDPHLNSLFDNSINSAEFVNKILTLPHEQIIKIYMKLTTLKHSISKNMQKEIEAKYSIIEKSFEENYETKNNYEAINNQMIKGQLKVIQKFNEKYELIAEKVIESKNLNKILHFSKALEKLKVNIRLLRSLMKDFDQNTNSKLLDELVNSLKISKILKEISNLTIKFDFTGIRSFEQERAFINNTKGAIFGLVEKVLTQLLLELPNQKPAKRQQSEKEIVNKLIVLTNINKLKDFRSTFYRNNLREMSELCKKCLSIGQTDDEKDAKNHLLVFQEYFVNTLHKKMVEISIIFIIFEEIIEKNSIKTALNTNFFEKYWQNLIEFFKGLLTWSIENDPKEWARDKLPENLFESFALIDSKGKINRYITSAIWKYPTIYEELASVSNEVHLFLIKNAKYHHYDFSIMKEKMIRELIPLCQLYYKHTTHFYQIWINKLAKYQETAQEENKQVNYPLNWSNQLFQDKSKSHESLQQFFRLLDWLLFNIKTEQIYDYHVDNILQIANRYFEIFKKIISSYDSSIHTQNNFVDFISTMKQLFARFKIALRRSSQPYPTIEYVPNLQKDQTKQMISGSQKLIILIQTFRRYHGFIKKCEEQFGVNQSR